MIANSQPKFPLGQIVATPGALEALQKAGQSAAQFLQRHARGDWGEVGEEDRQANDQSLVEGSRLLSAYRTSLGEKIWIITEAVDDAGKHYKDQSRATDWAKFSEAVKSVGKTLGLDA